MLRRVYKIDGFDCAACAEKSERHLNEDARIGSARIDFVNGRLTLVYVERELSVDEIKAVIAEVESDPLEISPWAEHKKTYHCSGFDCAACAEKAERHLNEDPRIVSARIDVVNERLSVHSGEALDERELLRLIAEVESDPIVLTPLEEKPVKKKNKKDLLLVLRIAYCVLVFVLCGFFFKDLYWVRFGLYLSALAFIEYDIALKVIKTIAKGQNPLDEYLLILIASTGAFVLACLRFADTGQARAFGNDVFQMEEHYEAILVCLLWQVGELLQDIALDRSRRAIEVAASTRVEEALLINEGTPVSVRANSLREGDLVLVNAGAYIPIDGVVIEGSGSCDTSSLTGESLPVALSEGSDVYGGTLLVEGEVRIRASKDYQSSQSAKILELVGASLERKGKAERFITRFARIYTPALFAVAIIYTLIASFVGPSVRDAVYTGLEILVISCPCAVVISVPLAYFAAIGLGSKNGILIKGAAFLDSLNRVRLVALDKTGTLTQGQFDVTAEEFASGVSSSKIASIVYSLESRSPHPLAKALCAHYSSATPDEVMGFASVPGRGVEGVIDGKRCRVGNADYFTAQELSSFHNDENGVALFVAEDDAVLAKIVLKDALKPSSRSFVENLKKEGIRNVILSGDKERNVAMTAKEVGVDAYVSSLLPNEKLAYIEQEIAKNDGALAYMGDGINDAPCLARADVGVAMGGLGAEMAVEEADILLLNDDPSYFLKARHIARSCRAVILFNIVFALAVKLAILVLAMVFPASIPMEVAVLADTGVSVLLTFHSLLLLTRKI